MLDDISAAEDTDVKVVILPELGRPEGLFLSADAVISGASGWAEFKGFGEDVLLTCCDGETGIFGNVFPVEKEPLIEEEAGE